MRVLIIGYAYPTARAKNLEEFHLAVSTLEMLMCIQKPTLTKDCNAVHRIGADANSETNYARELGAVTNA